MNLLNHSDHFLISKKEKSIFTLLFISLLALTALAQDALMLKLPNNIAPVIDGQVDGLWNGVEVHSIDKPFVSDYDVPTLDLATWQAVWNDTAIFILVNVKEDNRCDQWCSGAADWQSDGVEVYLDVNLSNLDDGNGPAGQPNGHYQFAWGDLGFQQDVSDYFYYGPNWAGANSSCAYSLNDQDYVYEYAIPFSSLLDEYGSEINPNLSPTIGFDVTIVDRDDYDIDRKRMVWMSDGNTPPSYDEAWNNMDACGEVRLISNEIGIASMYLSDTSIDFSDVYTNMSLTKTLSIWNYSSEDTLTIENIANLLNEYSVDKTDFIIIPGTFETIAITFKPTTSGSFEDSLTIYNNFADTVVLLSGNGIPPPEISFSPESFDVSFTLCDDSISLPLKIYNTGESELEFSLSTQYICPTGIITSSLSKSLKSQSFSTPVFSTQEAIQRTIDKNNLDKESYVKSTENIKSSSIEIKSANLIYVDVNSTSLTEDGSEKNPYKTILSAVNNASSGDKIVVIPGIYYEDEISINKSLTLNGNGSVIIGSGSNSVFGISGGAYDVTIKNFVITNCEWGIFIYSSCSGPVNVINNTIYNHSNSGVVVFPEEVITIMNNIICNAWFGIAYYSGTLNNSYNNVYGNANNWGDCSQGEGSISLDPLFVDVAVNNFTLQPGSPCINEGNPDLDYNDPDGSQNDMGAYGGPEYGAYSILNWLSCSPDSGIVNINDSVIIEVKIKSTDLVSGIYKSNIIINSNDPLSLQDTVQCTLTLNGSPEISLSDTCFNFDDVFINGTKTDTLKINNTGCDSLYIDNVISSS
ncbi:MAG: choice-of-anchor D domain-containing protein, partial [Bacteroidales bacterium]|nr:choice-of-anchor D domain-containing protein [Bacteroidales bacterium]